MIILTIVCSCIMDLYLFHLFFSNYFDKRESVAGDIREKVLCFATAFCVLCGCAFLFSTFFQSNAAAYTSPMTMVIRMIVIKFLSYIIILLINRTIGRRKRIENTKVFWMYMLIPISSLIVMFISFYFILNTELSFGIRLLFIFSFGFLVVGNVVSFYTFEFYSENLDQNLQQNLVILKQEKDLEYYMQIAEIDKKQKELIHDISNQMKIISYLANQKDYMAILKISGELREEIQHDKKQIFCNNTVLNSILNEKKGIAEQWGIDVDVYVEPSIVLNIAMSDIISMFGNLLDNAIRAASEAQGEKYIKVFIYMHEVGGFCVVKIVNTYNKVELDKGKFLSTKTSHGMHGIGIRSVNRTAKKYNGYLNCSIKNGEFEALLLLSTANDESF